MKAEAKRKAPTAMEAALGGLLHDVGKAMQRAHAAARPPGPAGERAHDVLPVFDGRYSHWHALWTDAFFDWVEAERLPWPKEVDPAWVRDLAVFHHRPLQAHPDDPFRVTTSLVAIGDRVSSGLDRKPRDEQDEAEGGRGAFRTTPLEAILTRLALEPTKGQQTARAPVAGAPRRGLHAPASLSPDALLPAERVDALAMRAGYEGVWASFLEGWRNMAEACASDVAAFEEGALDLSERFFWSIPSSTIDQPDVSLHDHARAVAAVAACLLAHHAAAGDLDDIGALNDAARPRLRFLVGDLSGLQKTLFRFRSEQTPGLARTLRGRSYRFQLIADAAARHARAAFDLPAACVLQSAGGRFLMLVPELGDARIDPLVDALRAEMDDWMAAQYFGDLAVGLAASPPFATRDLVRAPEESGAGPARDRARGVRDRLQIAVETAKLRQLQGPASAVVSGVAIPHGPCEVCGAKPAVLPQGRCAACEAEFAIGRALPAARAIVVGGAGRPTDCIFGLGYTLATADAAPNARGWRLVREARGPAPLRFGAAHVARFGADLSRYDGLDDEDDIETGAIKTFAALARDGRRRDRLGREEGVELLAVLKADVDRLGALFAKGLGDDFGLARPAQLSRMLDAYFTGRLRALLKREFPDSYTVYAGGDDLMIVAPWREALRLAARLRADFAAFTLGNPHVTLSAGVALADPRAPISLAAEEAEERLGRAKSAGRNRVCAVEREPMAWPVFEAALAASDRLDAWLGDGRLTTAGLYRFLAFDDSRARLARAAAGDGEARPTEADFGWRARFGYHLTRMLPEWRRRPDQRELAEALLDLFGLNEGFAGGDARPGARLAISAALYAHR